ncbi:MAG: AbrB/MazE/SpoVT family DNA-binding domain-containing protein [Pseudomonas palmensis]|uniref:AbrB/MazE/SpoVT family DNA-binding domain-containing protein n=1 Tax=Pseudomonas palmensis TaxID=2815362 RepID=UPI003D09842D
MTKAKVNNPEHMVVKCLEAGDGSGDSIIELPDKVLDAIGVKVGDQLSIEKVGDVILLKPIRDKASAK